jgi:hypothetical protein
MGNILAKRAIDVSGCEGWLGKKNGLNADKEIV